MQIFVHLSTMLTVFVRRARDDEGDVPGWVMVTVMTAILVVAILGVFEPQIKNALTGIIDSISAK